MTKKYAVRNIRLCTKDCLCLYVCPTGATDTENSVIDVATCIGCGDCADACPSAAISMVPFIYPPPQPKQASAVRAMRQLLASKNRQEQLAEALPGRLAEAFARSNRIMAEDLAREAGFMLAQSDHTRQFLRTLLETETADDFPADAVRELLKRL